MSIEFQVVLLAGGRGSRLYPLTDGGGCEADDATEGTSLPKCLLPVGGVPAVVWALRMIAEAGFSDVLLVLQKDFARQVTGVLSATQTGTNVDVQTIDEEMGTADTLRMMKEKIKKSFIVVSADVIGSVDLRRLTDVHRVNNAAVTALFNETAPLAPADIDRLKKTKRLEDRGLVDYVGITKEHKNDTKGHRLISLTAAADLEDDTIAVPTQLVKQFPNFELRTDLLDMHVYIMARWVLEYLAHNKHITTIKGELIPKLLKSQYTNPNTSSDAAPFKFASEAAKGHVSTQQVLSINNRGTADAEPPVIKCCALVTKETTFGRANTMSRFMDLNNLVRQNKDLLRSAGVTEMVSASAVLATKSQWGESLVAESVTVGTKSLVKRSVIGKHCKIGNNVKLVECVLLNHVTIADNCSLQGAVICQNAFVSENCHLQYCHVGPAFTVDEGTTGKPGEVLVADKEY